MPADRRALTPRSGFILTALLTLLAALLGAFTGLGRADQTLYDRALSLIGRPAQADIVLVTIDDNSIAMLGRWPWKRQVHAALIDKLHEARAVGLDLIFSEADQTDPAADSTLARAMRAHGKVVLPIVLDKLDAPAGYQPPIPMLAQAAADMGFINIPVDADGVVRHTAWQRTVDGHRWTHFSLALLRAGGQADQARRFAANIRNDSEALIPFAGPPGHYAMVPYLDVLEGRVPPSRFRGKYVIVGSWATGLTDTFPTPVSHRANGMAGMEILANLLQAANEDRSLRTAASWENALATALPVLLLCLVMRHGSPKLSLALNGMLLVLILPGAALMLRYGQIWFPPSAALFSLALCYPIWSWRSQEAVLRYMDDELKRLRRDYAPVLDRRPASLLLGHRSVEDRLGQFRRALALVRNLRQFLTDGLNGLPDATLVFDQEGRLQFRNRAAAQFFRRLKRRAPHAGQQLGEILTPLLPSDSTRERIAAFMQEAASKPPRSGWSADVETRVHGGRDMIFKCAPIHSGEGEFVGTILTLSDISDIRHAERQREETLRFISHDMRAPQNSILALVAMHENDPASQDQAQTLQRIAQLSRRTLHLVDGFVQLTRAESMKIHPVPLDLADLLREVCDDFWAPSQARGIAIALQEPLVPAFVMGDQTLLRRALSNLLDNAIKYSPKDSQIRCDIRRDAAQWVVSIADQGPGIAADQLEQVFQPFTRVGSAVQADAGGAGLGLAFVRAVAERHHGRAEVRSTPGQGSTFLLRLPSQPA
ncbi:CHASE2 domain-containing protein [Bordetella hinzii]|uniref:CHASE2 domain-containing protein n=1 Tax=Bordetella hinzii TaxID=103855 RepID=UPI0013EFF2CF|nr:CHASE2 domain-containing protein [Bordetella hinzii]QII83256.1 CHASE2 domain-containing protein [Bordetella hinzii]